VSDSITGNSAQYAGAGIQNNGSNLTVTDSTIADNMGGVGTGIYSTDNGIVSIIDSTIANNTHGGGIVIAGGSLSVVQSTLVGNTNTADGAGAAINASSADVSMVASIMADPAGPPTGGECAGSESSFPDDGYNTADDTSCDLSSASSIEHRGDYDRASRCHRAPRLVVRQRRDD
jgi:hypothetical protein